MTTTRRRISSSGCSETIFNKELSEAFEHHDERPPDRNGYRGRLYLRRGQTKVKTTRQLAEEHEFPLLVTMGS
jgi:hypothetical protein